MSILVTGDNAKDRKEVSDILIQAGYEEVHDCLMDDSMVQVGSFIDRDSNRISITNVDLVIFDAGSTEESLGVIREIKGSFQYKDIPIVVLADSSTPGFLKTAFAAGAIDFIVKPLIPEELVARLRSSLKLKHEIDRRKAREKELTEATIQLSELNNWLQRLSLVDGLTKAANRRGFDKFVSQEWRRSVRSSSYISLVMIDVDFFKDFNDRYGHREGDSCLVEIVNAIRSSVHRPGDILCRYGGEEFAVILAETHLEGACYVAERIREMVEGLKIPHGQSKISEFVTISAGVATDKPNQHRSMEQLVTAADRALYQAKKEGRNRVVGIELPDEKKAKAS